MLSTYSPSERDTDPEVGAVRLGQAEIETEFTVVLIKELACKQGFQYTSVRLGQAEIETEFTVVLIK